MYQRGKWGQQTKRLGISINNGEEEVYIPDVQRGVLGQQGGEQTNTRGLDTIMPRRREVWVAQNKGGVYKRQPTDNLRGDKAGKTIGRGKNYYF